MVITKKRKLFLIIALSVLYIPTSASASSKSDDLNNLFLNWEQVNSSDKSTLKIDENVTLTSTFPSDDSAMFSNTVNIFGKNHTYSFSNGDSTTSPYYMLGTNDETTRITGSLKYYRKINEDGNADLARVLTSDDGVQVAEKITLDAFNRSFKHEVTIRNGTHSTLTNQYFGTYLDTMLDDKDDIPIYAAGGGGTYIENSSLKLYNKPLSNNIGLMAGYYSDGGVLANKVPVTDQKENDEIVKEGDTAFQYQTKTPITLEVNSTIKYDYSEALYSQDEPDPVPPPNPTWPNGSPSGWKNFAGQDIHLLNQPDNSLFGDYVFYSKTQAAIFKIFKGEEAFNPGNYRVTIYAKGLNQTPPTMPLKVSLKKDYSSTDSRTLLLADPLSTGDKVEKGYYKVSADITLAEDEKTPLITVENYQGGYISGIFIEPTK